MEVSYPGFNRKCLLSTAGELHLGPGKRTQEKVIQEQSEQLKNLVYLEYLQLWD